MSGNKVTPFRWKNPEEVLIWSRKHSSSAGFCPHQVNINHEWNPHIYFTSSFLPRSQILHKRKVMSMKCMLTVNTPWPHFPQGKGRTDQKGDYRNKLPRDVALEDIASCRPSLWIIFRITCAGNEASGCSLHNLVVVGYVSDDSASLEVWLFKERGESIRSSRLLLTKVFHCASNR